MALNGDEGGFIPLDEAVIWTANYRNSDPGATRAHFFGIHKILQLLGQDNCVGIRVYYAINTTGERQLVMVGVDAQERDILATGVVLDQSFPCPSCCDALSPLN
jgi:hypothetical protein